MTTEPAKVSSPKLSVYVKLSIALLILFTAAALTLLFVADFEGRVARITSTFFIFAAFITLTMFDTSILRNKPSWYPPTATIANSYFMGLMLIITWASPYKEYYSVGPSIFGSFIGSLIIIRGALFVSELISAKKELAPAPLQKALTVSTVTLGLSAISFTLPFLFSAFQVTTPSLYWKFATAFIILTGLSISISMLLKWNYLQEIKKEQLASAPIYPTNPLVDTASVRDTFLHEVNEEWKESQPVNGATPVDLPPPTEAVEDTTVDKE